ncbi:hypothetical protein GR160_13000 [Flavobacterium sp. Sd200]|uniref:hypothetical protein n=1 Tax=Flavobacterium sp. Sd200 TaxID=2692211 RepID=UPI00137217EF|nr:hypothetical protein [Flavobacterium sp. Sd200]MXN92145.1 hypothetical protein [Flavobacterium sp. Sd200]
MKTTQILAAALFATGIFTVNAQTQNSSVTSFGLNAGTSGTGNAFFGYSAGYTAPNYGMTNSTIMGYLTGGESGTDNVLIGNKTGQYFTDGYENVFVGATAGQYSTENSYNVLVGFGSGANITYGNNTMLGHKAGYSTSGGGNIFLGYNAGYNEISSNKLYIENSSSSTPLIWGDFANDLLKFNGKVGIGLGTAAFPTTGGSINVAAYKLIVNGGILAKEVRVATTWADYVFEDNYKLPTLPEVEQYINENGHLPNVPSAKQIEEDGIEVGEMAKIQQEKIEELTLYAIQQQKQLEKQQKEIDELKALVLKLAGTK